MHDHLAALQRGEFPPKRRRHYRGRHQPHALRDPITRAMKRMRRKELAKKAEPRFGVED